MMICRRHTRRMKSPMLRAGEGVFLSSAHADFQIGTHDG
jgi:hypothetical protein